jgi:uncharacterized protein YacL
MSRTLPELQRHTEVSSLSTNTGAPKMTGMATVLRLSTQMGWEFWTVRALFVVGTTVMCYIFEPFHMQRVAAAILGSLMSLVILFAELRLRHAATPDLLGGALGAFLGVLAALPVATVLSRTAVGEPTKSFLECAALLVLGYLGLVLGWQKGRDLRGRLFAERPAPALSLKLLDTSVLIDGRIADVCEAQFIDGVLVVPQFVLRELQMVADSSDPLKRQRGRRGLEVLQRIQKIPHVEVRVVEDDFPQAVDVDHKLIELARRNGAKIVTNDFNLNKVATVQGLSVLNVNELANALKPVVLPGEQMRVFILREGKEANQGVAYLDDGTMVVVDGARRFLNKTIDIAVTSVHQTTAGKMIFGRLDERVEQAPQAARQAAAAAAGAGRSDVSRRVQDPPATDRAPRPIFPESDAD